MPPINRVQALIPAGAAAQPNPNGTAPGICARLDRARIWVMPGVPHEMKAMAEALLQKEGVGATGHDPTMAPTGPVILATTLHTFGQGESTVAQKIAHLTGRDRNPLVGTTVARGIVSVRVRARFDDPATAQHELADTADQVEQALGEIVFGRDATTLPDAVVATLTARGLTLATAESCTGGLIGQMITAVPGASVVYRGGWVTYTNAMKTQQLGVPMDLIETHGAVSEPVACAMARGALDRCGADLAISVTGIAGPDGGTPDKPIGTVCLGLAQRDGAGQTTVTARRLQLTGDRAMIRDRAARTALDQLRRVGRDGDRPVA